MTNRDAAFPTVGPLSLPRWLEILFLLLLPVLTYWCFNYRQVHQHGSIDPYIYTGYINNAEDLLKRLDLPYYSVRFGLILPGRFLTWALGSEPGYFALRYVLSLAGGIPLYLAAKRLFSPAVGVLAYVALITSPWFGRTLLWDHPDATGVPFLMAAMCLILLSRTPSWLRDGMAGCCASMAINSNAFTGVVLAIFGTVYVALSLLYGTDRRVLLRRAIMFGAGFMLVVAVGYGYYWHVFGERRNIFKPTFDVANGLARGGMKQYRYTGTEWLLIQIHVFVPVLLSLCCLVLCLRRRMRFEVAVCALAGSGTVAFFWVHQFLLDGDTLQLIYYFSYQLPTTFLMLVCIGQALWERFAGKAGVFLAIGVGATLCPLVLIAAGVHTFEIVEMPFWVRVAVPTVVLVTIAAVPWRSRGVRATLAMASLVMITFSAALGMKEGVFRIARPYDKVDNKERDVYRVALQLIQESPKRSQGPGNLKFWYTGRRSSDINSIQSTYLWGFTRLQEDVASDPGIPYLGEYEMTRLRDPETRYVIILGDTPQEVQAGLQALNQVGTGYNLLSARDLHSGTVHVYWQMVELTKRPK